MADTSAFSSSSSTAFCNFQVRIPRRIAITRKGVIGIPGTSAKMAIIPEAIAIARG